MNSTPPSASSTATPVPRPCPDEGLVPEGAPSSVSDNENVIRLVPSRAWLIRDGRGRPALGPTAFPQDELRQRAGKTVSVLRGMTADAEIERRARALNSETTWADDPVVAIASVCTIREMTDSQDRRELCVNADPTTATNDKLGPCTTHASIVRSCPPLDPKQRVAWGRLRLVRQHFRQGR